MATKIDWLKAAVLERMNAEGYTREDLCRLTRISAPTLRQMWKAPSAEWDYRHRRAILTKLHIKIADFPKDVQIDIASKL